MASKDLERVVAKGARDGLRVTALGCEGDEWALIFEERTAFSDQKVLAAEGKHWLPLEKLEDLRAANYFVTAFAGEPLKNLG